MINKLLEFINTSYPLKKNYIQEYSHIKVRPMTFEVENYTAKGLGNITVMKGTALFGIMKMDTLVINPFEIDMPLYSYDRIHVFKNDTLYQECYDTLLDESKRNNIDQSLHSISNKYNITSNIKKEPAWYDDILFPSSIFKKTKSESNTFDQFALDYLSKYLELSKEAEQCDVTTKKTRANQYTEGLLNHGGPSTDVFIKNKGKEFTEKFFYEVFFKTRR